MNFWDWFVSLVVWNLNSDPHNKHWQIPQLVVTRKVYFYPRTGFYFRTCEDGAGWHLIPYIISPRSEFFSQAYKNWHITWGINLGPDWLPLARGSKFHTIHTPTRPLNFRFGVPANHSASLSLPFWCPATWGY